MLLCLALLAACGDDGSGPTADGGDFADADGDGILDMHEGADEGVDTDGDGMPDFRDLDSDGDGIPDELEAGDDVISTPPVDSDDDGVPDFRDLDSDENGIPDLREGTDDTDGDGVPDFADLDDDVELAGRTDFPADSDADGIPDFRDVDSDGDGIHDRHEHGADTDRDETPDYLDSDSDDDGIPDAIEAGDSDLDTPPVDTDEDGKPDFRDRDSDNDGLPDGNEIEAGTDRLSPDSDGDGVSDLIEVGAGTDALDPDESPRTRGDFVFVVPYLERADPERDTLLFRTNIQYADVYFQFDTTGSMSGEIAAMKEAVTTVIENLTCDTDGTTCRGDLECAGERVCSAAGQCISDPRVSGCIADLWTGVGTYEGNPNSYRNLLALQADPGETQRRIPASASGGGASESLFESVACVADPGACSGAECTPGGAGCPAYRADAVRMLVTITDEPNQCTSCSVNTAAAAGGRLADAGIVFVGVDADASNTPEPHLKAIARAANSLDAAGEPLYVQGSESSVTTAVTEAIRNIARNVPIFVSVAAEDLPDDDGDALQFIDHLIVNTSGEDECTAVASVADTDGNGHADAFPSLLPGTPVCWDVVPRENDLVPPVDRPLVFRARIVVRGDGSILDQRTVYFLVPPQIDIPVFG